MSESENPSRREFLRNTTVVAAGVAAATSLSAMPSIAEGMRRVIGANDRINVGHVGIGVQGFSHVRWVKDNAQPPSKDNERSYGNNTDQIAVCDIYVRAKKQGQKHLGLSDSQCFDDYRKMLEIKGLDAVFVTTSDQWHAPVAIDAMMAGKHVYCEKPMCKTMDELFKIYDTAKSTKRTFQIGAMGCSDEKWHVAGKLVGAGRIGQIILGQGSYMRPDNKKGEWNPYRRIDADAGPTASGDGYVNWEVFRKGAGPKDWDPDRYFRWRKYWSYGSGLIGDLFPHRLNPLFIAMNLSQDGLNGWPKRVSCNGGLYVQKIHPMPNPDDVGAGQMTEKDYLAKYHAGSKDWPDRDVPDFNTIVADFDGCTMMAMSSSVNEQGLPESIRGNKATLFFGGQGVEVRPERDWSDEVDAAVEAVNGPGESTEYHEKNFFDCIRSGKPTTGNIELASRVQTVICLAERSYRENKMFNFDPKTRKVTA